MISIYDRALTSIVMRAYFWGHVRRSAPRRLRRLIAGTGTHRAWIVGWLGYFEQDGVAYGPAFPYPKHPNTA